MLYLFNSAFRPKYSKNVMNTLYLPEGCSNEYRYRSGGDHPNVSASFMSNRNKIATNTECVIVFIDRFASSGYCYHPLRIANLISFRDEAGYLFAKVALKKYIYPRNLQKLQTDLLSALSQAGLPRLTGDDPENPSDGHYILEAESIFGQASLFFERDEAWEAAVGDLEKTRALSANENQWPVFMKSEVRSREDQKTLLPVADGAVRRFEFTRDKTYELAVAYRFPKQMDDRQAQFKMQLHLGDVLRPLSATDFAIDSIMNRDVKPFGTRKYAEDMSGSIALGIDEPPQGIDVIYPDVAIEFTLTEGTRFWLAVAASLLIYCLAGALLAADFSKLNPFSWKSLASLVWPRMIIAFFQALALVLLFRKIGKKVL